MRRDPYRYFRAEAAELHERLAEGLLDLEEEPRSERVIELLRAAHTLKGAARVVGLAKAAGLAHTLEDQLAGWRDGERTEGLEPLFATLDAIATEIRSLPAADAAPAGPETGPPPAGTGSPPGVEAEARPVPSEVSRGAHRPAPAGPELEALMHRTLGVTARLVRARQRLGSRFGNTTEHAVTRQDEDSGSSVADELEAALRDLAEIRQAVEDLRLTQAAELLHFLRRAARDIARDQGKRVVVELRGKEEHFDTEVARALREPLLHAITNAVTHGVPDGGQGRVTLSVQREGSLVVFRVADDGPGLDLPALLRAARARGSVGPDEGDDWSTERLAQLAFRPGVSTASSVDQLSGRGIGLDALRQSIKAIQGDVRFVLDEGPGTILELRVPFSTYAVSAVHVTACGRRYALPLHSVVEVVKLTPEELLGEEVVVAGATLPLGSLRRALELDVPTGDYGVAMVLRHGQRLVVLAVDRVEESEELAVFPLPPWTGPVPAVSGIARGPGGEAIPMLSVQHLVSALGRRPGLDHQRTEVRRPPVLVVDDSLTSRMLQQSILETAGYTVETAASPTEGLLRLAQRSFGLLLVDIEMPGMDGFTFLERTRNTPEPVPAMLISSRDSPEDRERGRQVGASAYVVKGEFDQPRFLALVEELIQCP